MTETLSENRPREEPKMRRGNPEPESLLWLLPRPRREARGTEILQPSPPHTAYPEHRSSGERKAGVLLPGQDSDRLPGPALRQTWS